MYVSIFIALISVVSISAIGSRFLTDVGTTATNNVVDMYGLINILYLKADKDANGVITVTELHDVYNGFDINHDGTITKKEFVDFWQLITHQTLEHAEAFFYLADLNDDNVIDTKDLAPMYHVFDLDGNGSVTAQEFGTKWMGIIRETPFAVLFERSDADKNNLLTKAEFNNFFITFDTNHDHKVSKAEVESAWTANGFADTVTDADVLFAAVDNDHDGFITDNHDMQHWFPVYDTNHNNQLDILEVVKMALLLPPVKLQ